MQKVLNKRIVIVSLLIAISMLIMSVPAFAAATGTHTPVEGVTVGVSDATDNSMTDGAVTVTAKGSAGVFGFGGSTKTATITITNSSDKKATITFNWVATSVNELKIDGVVQSGASGMVNKELESNASLTVTITTAKDATVNTLMLSGFSIVKEGASFSIEVNFNSLGSVTVDGVSIESGSTHSVGSTGMALVATPVSGAKFVAWINSDTNEVISKQATQQWTPSNDMSIEAVFTQPSAAPLFFVNGGKLLLESLDEALNYASSNSNKVIALAGDATLPAGNYTIPAGITLLIPNDEACTVYTSAPGGGENYYVKPSVYRTLAMADGASITVNGAISVAGMQVTWMNYRNGAPCGPLGYITMAEGSSIIVNSGANLYAWGYILGEGTVEINNGGTVYEDFQIADWRGGTVTSGMLNKSQRVFPMNQLYIMNVQVPMTLHTGAVEKVCTAVTIGQGVGLQRPCPVLIGEGGLFQLSGENSVLVKDYDDEGNRCVFQLNGTGSLNNLTISLKLGLLGSATINSGDYVLPFGHTWTLVIKSNSKVTVNQDIAMLPGSIVEIEENATVTLSTGANLFIYDADNWGKFAYRGSKDNTHVAQQLPNGSFADISAYVLRDAQFLVNGTLDCSAGGIYTTNGGASIISNDAGKIIMGENSNTVTYQYSQIADEDDGYGKEAYVSIDITSANLQNADGNYVTTAAGTYTHCATHGWYSTESCAGCASHTHSYTEKVTKAATCTEAGEKTYTCSCGDSYTEAIAATGHTAGAAATCESAQTCTVCGTQLVAALGHKYNSVVTAPTCTEKGYTTHTCSVCSHSYISDEVAANGHNYESVVTAPTCTDGGYTTHTCTVCGDTYQDSLTSAAGHSYGEWTVTYSATCMTKGEERRDCKNCDHFETQEIAIDANVHTGNNHTENVKNATCSEEGYTGDTVCECGVTVATGTTTSKLAHTEETIPGKAATCTETGLTDGVKCSVCGETITAQEEIPMVDHSMGDWIVDTAATCEDDGSKHKECANCDYEETEVIPALGHSYESVVTAPSCVEQGYTTHTCANCGDSYVDTYVDAVDHDWCELSVNPATCDNPGTRRFYCLNCNEKKSEEIPALGHSFTNYVPARDGHEYATCDNDDCTASDSRLKTGFVAGGQCGDNLLWELNEDGIMYISGTGEMYDYTVQYSGASPWVNDAWKITTIILEDGATSIGDYAFYYDYGNLKTVVMADSVTNIGTYAFYFCSEMTELTISNGLEVVEEGAFSDCYGLKELTFSETVNSIGAYAFQNCQNLTKITFVGDAPAFNAAAFGYASSITVYYPCDNETWTNDVLQNYGGTVTWMANHVEVIDEAVDPTCIETGKTEGKHCSICDEVLVAQETVDALGHSYTASVTTAATCTTDGVKTYTCSTCGDSYTETIEAMGHTEGEAVKENETATSYESVVYCSVCGAELSRETIDIGPVLDESLKFSGHNLELKSELSIQWSISNTLVENAKDFYVIFTKTEGYVEETRVIEYRVGKEDMNFANSKYYAKFPYISACDMGVEISAVLYIVDADGSVRYSNVDVYSVRHYANALMNKYQSAASSADTTTKAYKSMQLAVELLNYGAAAQEAFSYKLDDKVNAHLSDEQRAFGIQECTYESIRDWGEGNATAEVVFKGSNLQLQSKISSGIRIDITNLQTTTLDGLTAVVTNAATGAIIEVITGDNFRVTSGKYYIDIIGIDAINMRTAVNIAVYANYGETDQKQVSSTATYSVESFTALANAAGSDSAAVSLAMLKYGDAASKYFA